jgi:hypothetical protein
MNLTESDYRMLTENLAKASSSVAEVVLTDSGSSLSRRAVLAITTLRVASESLLLILEED